MILTMEKQYKASILKYGKPSKYYLPPRPLPSPPPPRVSRHLRPRTMLQSRHLYRPLLPAEKFRNMDIHIELRKLPVYQARPR